jgi:hypothetical protein
MEDIVGVKLFDEICDDRPGACGNEDSGKIAKDIESRLILN